MEEINKLDNTTKWGGIGFLDGIENEIVKNNVSGAMELCSRELVSKMDIHGDDYYVDGLTTIIFPIIRKVFTRVEDALLPIDIYKNVLKLITELKVSYNSYKSNNKEDISEFGVDNLAIFTNEFSNIFELINI